MEKYEQKNRAIIMNPPYRYVGNLNGPAYYKTCPIRYNNEREQNMTFSFHSYSTKMETWEQLKGVRTLSLHCLSLLIKGELHLTWGEYKDVVIRAGEMYFIPRGAEVSGYIVGDVEVIIATIGRGMTGKELDDLRKMKTHEPFQKYEFKPLPMHPPMIRLAESIKEYLVSGVNCSHLHESKSSELYVILHWYYSIADNSQLFYPMAGAISEFRNFVLDNYKVTTTIDELVERANMSRSTFDRKFKETFGTTPKLWIEEQTRQTIISKASEPNVTVKDMMYEVGVYNSSQFTKLCRRLCGVTPSQLIRP